MPIYRGKSADGSDMEEMEGMYVSPNGKFWGSNPISLAEEKEMDLAFNKKETRKERRQRERLSEK